MGNVCGGLSDAVLAELLTNGQGFALVMLCFPMVFRCPHLSLKLDQRIKQEIAVLNQVRLTSL